MVGVRYLKRLPHFQLNPLMIFGMTAFYAFLFEYILPNSSPLYVADFVDVIMYAAGAVFYWLYWMINSNNSEKAVSQTI